MIHTIQRLHARVSLDDPAPALARAEAEAERGDDDWREWLEDYGRGDALVVRLELWAEFETDRPHRLRVEDRGIWVETQSDPPKLEAQIAELVASDFDLVCSQLRAHGFHCAPTDLAGMYVHVELLADLRRTLRDHALRGGRSREPALSWRKATAAIQRLPSPRQGIGPFDGQEEC